MRRLIALKDRFDVAFACDTDHDRHGIVTREQRTAASQPLSVGGHRLPVPAPPRMERGCRRRQDRRQQRHDRPRGRPPRAAALRGAGGIQVVCRGLLDGCARLRRRGKRRRIVPAPRRQRVDHRQGRHRRRRCWRRRSPRATGRDPGEAYRELTRDLGEPFASRVDAPATPAQKKLLGKLDRSRIRSTTLAGEPIVGVLTHAPGNNAPIGGVKVMSKSGWFAARPSGTENIYKIYAESFVSEDHLRLLLTDAQAVVDAALGEA